MWLYIYIYVYLPCSKKSYVFNMMGYGMLLVYIFLAYISQFNNSTYENVLKWRIECRTSYGTWEFNDLWYVYFFYLCIFWNFCVIHVCVGNVLYWFVMPGIYASLIPDYMNFVSKHNKFSLHKTCMYVFQLQKIYWDEKKE